MAGVGRPGQPGRLADGHGEAPGDRPAAPARACSSESARSSAASSRSAADGREPDLEAEIDDAFGDDLLRLIFTACHPVLSTEARVALTLRLLGGLTTEEIARAFLVPEPTVAQRIVRAKRTLAEARVPFEVPERDELAERLASVLEVDLPGLQRGLRGDRRRRLDPARAVRGGAAAGPHPRRAAPGEPEVHGLVALMELQASRSRARVGPDGEPVLLLDQDRARWDQLLIRRGLAALERAPSTRRRPRAVHAAGGDRRLPRARAGSPTRPTGSGSSPLYDALAQLRPRRSSSSTARSRSRWPSAPRRGSSWSTRSSPSPRLRGYHLLPSVRGDLLAKLGRDDEARAEFERAAALTQNARERAVLLERMAACSPRNGDLPR